MKLLESKKIYERVFLFKKEFDTTLGLPIIITVASRFSKYTTPMYALQNSIKNSIK